MAAEKAVKKVAAKKAAPKKVAAKKAVASAALANFSSLSKANEPGDNHQARSKIAYFSLFSLSQDGDAILVHGEKASIDRKFME